MITLVLQVMVYIEVVQKFNFAVKIRCKTRLFTSMTLMRHANKAWGALSMTGWWQAVWPSVFIFSHKKPPRDRLVRQRHTLCASQPMCAGSQPTRITIQDTQLLYRFKWSNIHQDNLYKRKRNPQHNLCFKSGKSEGWRWALDFVNIWRFARRRIFLNDPTSDS